MKKPSNRKGFAIVFAVILVIIFFLTAYSLYSLAFSSYNIAMLDHYKQQAHYNAVSGVEYAQFILENSNYSPPPADPPGYFCSSGINPTTPPSPNPPPLPVPSTNWPKTDFFYCFKDDQGNLDQNRGTVIISIISDGVSGYYVTSTGTVNNVTTSVIKLHYAGGVIDSWY